MEQSKRFWRALLFIFLLAALCGSFAFPVAGLPVSAAPRMQATSCLGTTIAQWTFENVTTPVIGTGTFNSGSGLSAPSYAGGSPGQAVSFSNWATSASLDINDYVEFRVPTIGRNSINLGFDYRATSTGPEFLEIHYSTDDGMNFVLLGSPQLLTRDSNYNALLFDFSSIPALNDNGNAVFRIFGYAADGASGTLRLDDVTFTGNCIFPADTETPTSTSTPTNTSTATSTATNTGTTAPTGTPTNTPTQLGFLSILINEVAWGGTGASSNDEWIELYNPGTNAINLSGWILKAADGTPTIELTGTIPAKEYFLLERTDDDTVVDAAADQIYTGALEDSSEILQLFDPTNRLIDTANSNGGNWPAGGIGTYGSMERRGLITDSDTAWITNVRSDTWQKHDARGTSSSSFLIHGTPGYANWAYSVTPTASPIRTSTRQPTPTRTPTPPPPPPLLVINEFVPRPGRDWNNDAVVNVDDEYIEILNHGVVDVNLSGYSLDDEVNIGSAPYRLPSHVLRPGERIVFYGSQTGLLLSDGGDGVRLLRPNGQLMDAYNYFVVRYPDQAFCRLPDNGGADDWNQNCFPTPGLQNSLSGNVPRPSTGRPEELYCPIADTLPDAFARAECDPYGNNIWNAEYWDRTGWYGKKYLPESNGRWPVFAD